MGEQHYWNISSPRHVDCTSRGHRLNPPVNGTDSALPCGAAQAPGDDHLDLIIEAQSTTEGPGNHYYKRAVLEPWSTGVPWRQGAARLSADLAAWDRR